jgi:hypothetical protein
MKVKLTDATDIAVNTSATGSAPGRTASCRINAIAFFTGVRPAGWVSGISWMKLAVRIHYNFFIIFYG